MSIMRTIEEADRTFERMLNSGDAAGLAALYTADGAVLPPGAPRSDGASGIRGFWQAAIDMGLGDVSLRPVEVEAFDDTAVEVGVVEGSLKAEGGDRTALTGKYVVIWKRGADGAWRLDRDIWNFDA